MEEDGPLAMQLVISQDSSNSVDSKPSALAPVQTTEQVSAGRDAAKTDLAPKLKESGEQEERVMPQFGGKLAYNVESMDEIKALLAK